MSFEILKDDVSHSLSKKRWILYPSGRTETSEILGCKEVGWFFPGGNLKIALAQEDKGALPSVRMLGPGYRRGQCSKPLFPLLVVWLMYTMIKRNR